MQHRGKAPKNLGGFRSNSPKWLEYTLRRNRCKRTYCVKADVENYEFDRPISFCLLDLALYRPTAAALDKIWQRLSPGGLAVVSNCKPGNCFDGAMQAYDEFTFKLGIRPRILHDRLGILHKTACILPSLPVLSFRAASQHPAAVKYPAVPGSTVKSMHRFSPGQRLTSILAAESQPLPSQSLSVGLKFRLNSTRRRS